MNSRKWLNTFDGASKFNPNLFFQPSKSELKDKVGGEEALKAFDPLSPIFIKVWASLSRRSQLVFLPSHVTMQVQLVIAIFICDGNATENFRWFRPTSRDQPWASKLTKLADYC